MKILGPAISLGRTAEEKRASRYQWLHEHGEDRGCNSGRYWSAWSNQRYPISADIENPSLRRTGLQVLVEQIPAGVQASKTTSFVRFDFTARVARIAGPPLRTSHNGRPGHQPCDPE